MRSIHHLAGLLRGYGYGVIATMREIRRPEAATPLPSALAIISAFA
jgi:hypothetical protein